MAQTESLWIATSDSTDYAQLAGDATADVCVIGGGIAGLCVARQLQQHGLSVAVVEANRIGAGVTGYTTAKVTSGHRLIYADLATKLSARHAQHYADANQWGVEWIASQGIECDLERKAMLVFAESDDELQQVRDEFDMAKNVGLPVSWTDSVDLPLQTFGAIRYENQVQFHPRKFLIGLGARIQSDGGMIYERTRVQDVKEDDTCEVQTDRGTIRCRYVVCASHYPVYDPSLRYTTRVAPYRDYALAAKISNPLPAEMSIGAGEEGKSFRTQGDLLIVSGITHKVGQADTAQCLRDLEDYTRRTFQVEEIPYRWSTQDNITPDSMPYIGRITSGSEQAFVVTGFNAWGMATGAYAGKVIGDLVTGTENPWIDTFDPNRLKGWESFKHLVKENLNVARRLIGDKLTDKEDRTVDQLQPGEGALLEMNGDKVGAFRDESGALFAVNPKCTHLGCDVQWNSAEQSWDCPCHGSRFDHKGNVIQGPAIKNLETKSLATEQGNGAELI